jgi:hypothetical protein
MQAGTKRFVWAGLILILILCLTLAGRLLLRPVSVSPKASEGGAQGGQTPEAATQAGSGAGGAQTGNAPATGSALTSEDQRKITVLTEILTTKNDNDPRMDTELKDLSPAAKTAIQKKYQESVSEKRNERGTLVFVLGREIKDASELGFFKEVLSERACLSLENCEKPPGEHSGEEEHLESINEATTNYPQLMALRALVHRANELVDTGQEGSPLYQSILETLRGAQQSPNPKVVELSAQALNDLNRE